MVAPHRIVVGKLRAVILVHRTDIAVEWGFLAHSFVEGQFGNKEGQSENKEGQFGNKEFVVVHNCNLAGPGVGPWRT